MLLSVLVGQLQAFFPEVLFHGWVHGQFLADGMAGQGPGELVPPLRFVFDGGGGSDVVGVEVKGVVVLADGFGDGVRLLRSHGLLWLTLEVV